jgi:RNA polymerase sigma-70 factor, ECF subfamily
MMSPPAGGERSDDPRVSRETAVEVALLMKDTAEMVFRRAVRATGGDRYEAEDLVQEAYQAAAAQWPQIRRWSRDRQMAWLLRIVINKAIDRWRVLGRLRVVSNLPDDLQTPAAERVALSRVAAERCLEVIKKMPRVQRRVAYLRWHEEWTTQEIALELGIKPPTVRVHLKNARDKLLTAVGDEVFLTEDSDEQEEYPGEEAQ